MLSMKSFRGRMIRLVLIAVISISVIVIALAVGTSAHTILTKSKQLALKQEETISNQIEHNLDSVYQLGRITRDNGVVYQDTRYPADEIKNYMAFTNTVYGTLLDLEKMNQNIDYIAVLKQEDQTIKYVGYPWTADRVKLYNELENNYLEADDTIYEDMLVNISEDIFEDNKNIINFFFPIYDEEKLYKEIGLVCIGIEEKVLSQNFDDTFMVNTCIIDQNNRVLAAKSPDIIGTEVETGKKYDQKPGIEFEQGRYILTNTIGSYQWLLQAEIPVYHLLEDSLRSIIFLLLFVIVFCALAVVVCVRITNDLYKPIRDIQKRMESFAEGDMSIRMNVEYDEDEFNTMARCFNKMVEDIEQLMETSKEEQEQMKQIELNALQSQIKPHFLYNTLECIHWQALMDGDKKVSNLVKALATYYRLCLSKGQDLVTLEQEIEHIRNYLIIQNTRYSDIVECEMDIPNEYYSLAIPKMTLQPLVENCIYHGIKVKEGNKGIISLKVREDNSCMVISVVDNGVGMSEEQIKQINETISVFDEKYGYGIRNVHKRLEILYGIGYGLKYFKNEYGGTTVEIRLPKAKEAGGENA